MKTILTILATILIAAAPGAAQIGVTGAGSQSVTLTSPTPISCGPTTPQVTCTAPPPTITLPIEVFGTPVVTTQVIVPVGSSVTGAVLWLQIHGLRYDTEASVQVNNSVWLPLSTAGVTMTGNEVIFGGIGGGFSTLTMTVALPAGVLRVGTNTVGFRFNSTDGISSGFRVLAFNFQTAGVNLLPIASFVQDDPTKWTPPLTDPADIAAGLTAWQSAALTDPATGAAVPIKAHCSDCHAVDGRDLKYFNYSNLSIESRATFHGLSIQQGQQIASYIRSLTLPSPGRPWNPPYQPGPGLDSQPVANWAAGAGLGAVLPTSAAMLAYEMPGGSTANLAATGYMNAREIPIPIQLLDWNRWLPTIHPIDSFGAAFATGAGITVTTAPGSVGGGYTKLVAELLPNNPANYLAHYNDIVMLWARYATPLLASVVQPSTSTVWNNPTYVNQIYSVGLYLMVKSWEINQMFGLEGEASTVMPRGTRAWYTSQATQSSPQILKIPESNSPGLGNGLPITYTYHVVAWDQLQLILNDGNGLGGGTWPIDRGYSMAQVTNNLPWDSVASKPRFGTSGLVIEKMAKYFQYQDSGTALQSATPYAMVAFPGTPAVWSDVSTAQKQTFFNAWLAAWLAYAQTMKAADLFNPSGKDSAMASPTFSAATGNFTGDLLYSLPQLNYAGASVPILQQIAAWATGFWPTGNWAAAITTPCTTGGEGNVTCK
jgi:hypothetical protein